MKKRAGDAPGNDQKPKPALGNSKQLHGYRSVDWSGGQGPGPANPKKAKKR